MAVSELQVEAVGDVISSKPNRGGPSTPSNSILHIRDYPAPANKPRRSMSRALDKSVKEALRKGDHKKVYSDISSLLTPSGPKWQLEIEVLGSSHPLQDGVNYIEDEEDRKFVAIPKLRIVQAFIVARQLFSTYLEASIGTGSPPSEEVLKPTAVMLLMDPEHLTAANARKRVIKHSMVSGKKDHASEIIHLEILFLHSLLTSRLHRHTKSPTLWSHRRWVVEQARALDPTLTGSLTTNLVEEIFISGERHPRNYYAWSHARYLVKTDAGTRDAAVLAEAVQETKKWCFKHHDDVSGWMYLLFVLGRLQAAKKRIGLDTPGSDAKAAFDETINLAKSFRWRNESVWYFLRNLIASELLGPREKETFFSALKDIGKGATTQDAAILTNMGAWMEQWSS